MKQGDDMMRDMLGDELLVAPVINGEGVRDVYLPAGQWVDLWTGASLSGARWRKGVIVPLTQMPVYVRAGATIPVYPESVQCTDEMDMSRAVTLRFDDGCRGISASVLGEVTGLLVVFSLRAYGCMILPATELGGQRCRSVYAYES